MKIPNLSISTHGDGKVLVSIETPDKENRGNVDIVCVIDVSGSMQIEATMKDKKGDVETHGLSILDVVKHSVKTIINTMKEGDRLSIVTFSTEAKIIFDLIPMSEEGRKQALSELEKLDVETQTNLWDGLLKGMEVVRKAEKMPNQSHVILFTDGLPNVEPPRSHLEMLTQYRSQYEFLRPTLHFFGFGYSLDSKLLEDLSMAGHGMYSYIPDSSFVGTIFVNALANIFSTLTSESVLVLEGLNGAKIEKVIGEFQLITTTTAQDEDEDEEEEPNNIIRLYPGTLRYGQRKDIVLEMKYPKTKDENYLRATLSFPTPNKIRGGGEEKSEKKMLSSTTTTKESGNWDGVRTEIDVQVIRLLSVVAMRQAIDNCSQVIASTTTTDEQKSEDIKTSQKYIDDLLQQIESCQARVKNNEFVKDLCKDLSGQVTLAISRKEWFERWGNHYLRSILCAHKGQYCNNFKDPGVQHHARGGMFVKYQEEGEEIFSKLPPPKPMPQTNPFEGTPMAHLWQPDQQQQRPQRNFSMREYYSHERVCVHGECRVGEDGKKVKDLKRGDWVSSTSRIRCVVKTVIRGGRTTLCEVGDTGLLVTPYHPIRVPGSQQWVFPCQISEEKLVACDAVYNFVLESSNNNGKHADGLMVINGVDVAVLGHGITGSRVIEHEYFGTGKVLGDLEKFEGWSAGEIVLSHRAIKRNKVSNLIDGLDTSFEVFE